MGIPPVGELTDDHHCVPSLVYIYVVVSMVSKAKIKGCFGRWVCRENNSVLLSYGTALRT